MNHEQDQAEGRFIVQHLIDTLREQPADLQALHVEWLIDHRLPTAGRIALHVWRQLGVPLDLGETGVIRQRYFRALHEGDWPAAAELEQLMRSRGEYDIVERFFVEAGRIGAVLQKLCGGVVPTGPGLARH